MAFICHDFVNLKVIFNIKVLKTHNNNYSIIIADCFAFFIISPFFFFVFLFFCLYIIHIRTIVFISFLLHYYDTILCTCILLTITSYHHSKQSSTYLVCSLLTYSFKHYILSSFDTIMSCTLRGKISIVCTQL